MSRRNQRAIRLGIVVGFLIMSFGAAKPAVALDSCLDLGLTLNRETTGVGDDLRVGVSLANHCSARSVDVYVVIVLPPTAPPSVGCPGSLALAFVTNGGSAFALRCQSASVATFPPFVANVTIPAAIDVAVHDLVAFTWPAGAPPGTYTLAIVATAPSAFADGVLDPGDILALGARDLTN
jgi:hypothetical protein